MPKNLPPGYRSFGDAGLIAPNTPEVRAAQFGLYNTPRSTGQLDFYRPRWFATGDIRKLVTEYDRWELMNFSRQLFAGLGDFNTAIQQKNQRSVGESWRAQYYGVHDRKWGDEAEEWLQHVFYPNCDLRGSPYDFIQDLILSGIALDVDGDDAMVLTEDEDTHFPKLQFIPSHRINTRMQAGSNTSASVTGGWASGARISQGIIYDSNDKVIGIRILGDGEAQDRDVPLTGCQLLYDPVWQSQNRGIPPGSVEMMTGLDLQDIQVFLKRLVKRVSSIGLIRTTEAGQADTGEGFISDTPIQDFSPGVKREQTRGGEDYYFTAGKGEKMEVLESNMPSDQIENFIKRLEHRLIMSLGWYKEMLDPKELGGANIRLIQDNVRATVRHRQKSIRMRAKRAVVYAIAKAMKYGFISRNDMDWWKFRFAMPAVVTVDAGHDAAGDFKLLALGVMTEEKYHAKYGDSAEQIGIQKADEVTRRILRAQQIADATKKDFAWVYEQLWRPDVAQQSDGPEGVPEGQDQPPDNGGKTKGKKGSGGSGGGGGDKDE